jgi:anhydro-N-acetylmuramic acid kinase
LKKSLYIGLMSGTSMDGIDAGLFDIDERRCTVRATSKAIYPPELRQALHNASHDPRSCNVDTLGHLDNWVGECFRQAAEQLIKESGIDRTLVRAIGSHGQTIRHKPRAARPFTIQIGDPNLIAAGTGITTVADFRRRDLALGGEGAPLASAFHQCFMSDRSEHRVVLNIGGIANITILPADDAPASGFDTGPGNGLLDAWIQHNRNEAFDSGGRWAESGRIEPALLELLLGDPYFDLPPPKSTGFEYFNLQWLQDALSRSECEVAAEDVQATLAVLSARSIVTAIRRHAPATKRVLACGGGVHNASLVRRLGEELAPIRLDTTASVGIAPDWVEAATFAWLAQRCLDGQPGNLPTVTGASAATILGAIYP